MVFTFTIETYFISDQYDLLFAVQNYDILINIFITVMQEIKAKEL